MLKIFLSYIPATVVPLTPRRTLSAVSVMPEIHSDDGNQMMLMKQRGLQRLRPSIGLLQRIIQPITSWQFEQAEEMGQLVALAKILALFI